MVKLTLIARVPDGLPLAESLYEETVLPDSDRYKYKAMSLIQKLSRGQNEASRMSLETAEPYVFFYIIEGRVCYLTMCDRSYTDEHAFQYLKDLKNEFELVDGPKVETAARPYEFGTFIEKDDKLYHKVPPSLVDLCLKTLEANISSFKQLQQLEEMNSGLSPMTNRLWKSFYHKAFGAKETELVQKNLTKSDTTFTWAELYHERHSSDQLFLSQQSRQMGQAYSAQKSRRRGAILLTSDDKDVIDRGDIKTEIANKLSMMLVEFAIVGPMIPPPGLVDYVRSDTLMVSTDEIIPEGRIYKVSCHESCDSFSPSTDALTLFFRAFNQRTTDDMYQTSLLSNQLSMELKVWSIVFGAQLSPKPNGYTMITISGGKSHVTGAFTRLVFLLRRCVFQL